MVGAANLNSGLTVAGVVTAGTLRIGNGALIERFDDGTLGGAAAVVPTARAVKVYVDAEVSQLSAQVTQANAQINQAVAQVAQLSDQLIKLKALYEKHQHKYAHYTYRDITTVNVLNGATPSRRTPKQHPAEADSVRSGSARRRSRRARSRWLRGGWGRGGTC